LSSLESRSATDPSVQSVVSTQFGRESDMREPVKAWLVDRGYLPCVEFWLTNAGITDIVAGAYGPRVGRRIPTLEEVVAVELKLTDVAGVISQARANRHLCDWSYAAMPVERVDKMRAGTLDKFASEGIGLLAVGDEIVERIAPIQGNGLPEGRREVKQLWRRVRHLSSC